MASLWRRLREMCSTSCVGGPRVNLRARCSGTGIERAPKAFGKSSDLKSPTWNGDTSRPRRAGFRTIRSIESISEPTSSSSGIPRITSPVGRERALGKNERQLVSVALCLALGPRQGRRRAVARRTWHGANRPIGVGTTGGRASPPRGSRREVRRRRRSYRAGCRSRSG